MTPELQNYCRRWSEDVARIDLDDDRRAYFQKHLPELLLDRTTLLPVLKNMAGGRRWPDLRDAGLFAHEVLLYLDASRRFSLRAFFHPPNTHSDIHDHTAWGISGTPFGRLSVIRFTCSKTEAENRVTLTRTRHMILTPGEVEETLPWNQGVHQTGSPDDAINLMLSVYGRPGRRLYIKTFDAATGQVHRRYPLKILRRMLAQQALAECSNS
jgi:hypothetical protein